MKGDFSFLRLGDIISFNWAMLPLPKTTLETNGKFLKFI